MYLERDIENISRVLYKEEMAETYEYEYKFLHKACMNKNVTLDIVKYLMDTFPDPKGEWAAYKFCPANYDTKAYPIHCACSNKNCPTSVIEYLMDKFPSTLEHLCAIRGGVYETHDWEVKGLPLHYYLAWNNSNIDIDIVKMMIETYPQSLMTSDEDWPCYPIHLVLSDQHCIINEELLMYLLELEPASIHLLDGEGRTILHLACYNEYLTLEIYQFILNKWPEATRMRDNYLGSLPIHALSMADTLDEAASIEILRSMLDIDPTFARDMDSFDGHRPIDWAVKGRPFEFCKVLIDLYPESLRDCRPIFEACGFPSSRDDLVDTIQYMLDLYPESINDRDGNGMLPIHRVAQGKRADIVELLLKNDPAAASRKTSGVNLPHVPPSLPLHLANERGLARSVKILYDAYPEALLVENGDGRSPLDLARKRGRNLQPIVRFLEEQLVYSQKAKDSTVMTAPDENGWLPLHWALKDKAPLGSIKLLVEGNPSALMTADTRFAFPLHIACQYSSAKVVRYLMEESNKHDLGLLDENKDSILHYACRGRNLDIVKYLLDEHTSLVSSVEVNGTGELPIHLLCKPGKDKFDDFTIINDYDGTECTEAIWRMLLVNPRQL